MWAGWPFCCCALVRASHRPNSNSRLILHVLLLRHVMLPPRAPVSRASPTRAPSSSPTWSSSSSATPSYIALTIFFSGRFSRSRLVCPHLPNTSSILATWHKMAANQGPVNRSGCELVGWLVVASLWHAGTDQSLYGLWFMVCRGGLVEVGWSITPEKKEKKLSM